MSAFYERMQAKAIQLVAKYGRDVTLIRPSRNLAVPGKKWKGVTESDDPLLEDSNERLVTIKSVVTLPNQVRVFGLSALGDAAEFKDLIQFSEKVHIIAPGTDINIKDFVSVRDEDGDWGINATQILRPGEITLLGYIGVRR
jgi:hypothetical protein